jgi:hypothetical protein
VPAAERKQRFGACVSTAPKTDDNADRLRQQLAYAEKLASLLAERAETKVGVGRG